MTGYSAEDLAALAGVVNYEQNMQRYCYGHLAEPAGPAHNLAVEGFLLHARSLIDFFYSVRGGADDVFAWHFITGAEEQTAWRSSHRWDPHDATKRLNEWRVYADKMLAHVTAYRISGPDQTKPAAPEPLRELRDELERLWSEFLRVAEPRSWAPAYLAL